MVPETKPLKVSTKTYEDLLRISGEIQQTSKVRITMEKTIRRLISFWDSGGKKK